MTRIRLAARPSASQRKLYRYLLAVLLALTLVGCATTQRVADEEEDALEPYNRTMFAMNEGLDKALLKPAAQAYQRILPDPVIASIGNFFSNLHDVVVLGNDLLQADLPRAARTSSRLVFNSTFGILGLFDVANRMELPKQHNDFGATLARWGVGEGPFIVLPLLGATTLRDSVGLVGDYFIHPVTWAVDSSAASWSLWGVDLVQRRASWLHVDRAFADAQIDPYTFQRSAYLQKRRAMTGDAADNAPKFDELDTPEK